MIKPNQIRAARALLHLEQRELADRAKVSVATVRRVEAPGEKPRATPRAALLIRQALEAAGAEFIPGGVRRKHRRSPEEVEARVRQIMAIADRTAKFPAENPGFGEDDLYDQFGLPA